MSSLRLAVAAAPIALAGCAEVFGLDDYALGQGAGGGAPASASTSAGGGAPGSSGPGGGGDGGASTPTSTTSTGPGGGAPPEDCRCIPTIPGGWTLVTSRATPLDAPESGCVGDRRVVAGDVEASCTCACLEQPTSCSSPTLRCWEQAACSGPVQDFQMGDACTAIGQRRSCEVLEGAPMSAPCAPQGTPAPPEGEGFDLCTATQRDAGACPGTGRCADRPDGEEVCIVGVGTCPEGWDFVQHDVTDLGDLSCPDCACGGRTCGGAEFRVSGNWGAGANVACVALFGRLLGADGCQDATNPDPEDPAEQARRVSASSLQGTCEPTAPSTPAAYAPGPAAKLCCLPPP